MRRTRADNVAKVAAALTVVAIVYYCSWRFNDGKDVAAQRRAPVLIARCEAPTHSHVIYFASPPAFGENPLWYFGAELSNPFINIGCSYSNCIITSSAACADRANLVALQGPFEGECCRSTKNGSGVRCTDGNEHRFTEYELPHPRPDNSFLFFQIEAPSRTLRECLLPLDNFINYTWSYKSDSDIYKPIGGYFASRAAATPDVPRDSYRSRPKNIVWFVSNCAATKQAKERYEYATELAQYISVDIKGRCTGELDNCSLTDFRCLAKVREQYKFYLAFENSRCDEYVTEKFFDALKFGNVPIVMGARRADYEALAPPGSFVFAEDFASPRELAAHLRTLIDSPQEFAKYHAWREKYRLKSPRTVFTYVMDDPTAMCKMCELATLRPRKSVKVSDWWSAESNCQ